MRSSTTRRAPPPTPTRASRRSIACSARWRRWRSTAIVLCLHGEVTDPDVDMFDRERVFVDTLLARIVRDFPGLKVVLEHITTREAAAFVRDARHEHRRHDHAAAPPVVAQRALRRRPPAALLLPADPEARNPPPGTGGGRDIGESAFLPRYRFGAPCAAHEGERLRLRRLLQRTRRPRALRRSVRGRGRARPARRIRACASAPTSTACRAMPAG